MYKINTKKCLNYFVVTEVSSFLKEKLEQKNKARSTRELLALLGLHHRLLSGVLFTRIHVLPGVDVGGKGFLSGTAA